MSPSSSSRSRSMSAQALPGADTAGGLSAAAAAAAAAGSLTVLQEIVATLGPCNSSSSSSSSRSRSMSSAQALLTAGCSTARSVVSWGASASALFGTGNVASHDTSSTPATSLFSISSSTSKSSMSTAQGSSVRSMVGIGSLETTKLSST